MSSIQVSQCQLVILLQYTRIESSSSLPTVSAYLYAVRPVLALILQIPPIDPSTSLRIAYLLRLTGDVLNAIPGYKLDALDSTFNATINELVGFLDDLDRAWMAVLQSQVWDPDSAEGIDLVLPLDPHPLTDSNGRTSGPPKSSPPSQTDLARLRSLLLSGESSLEEWLTNQAGHFSEDTDVSIMLARMGLLDHFDSLFSETLDFLRAFSGDVSRNVVEPEFEATMGDCGL